jgi:multiple sugar transport system substrate-binding protein
MPEALAAIQQGTNMSILKSGDPQKDLASYLFLKHIISSENTADFAMNTGYLPVRTSGYLSAAYQTFLGEENNAIAMVANVAYIHSDYFFYDPAFIGSSRARAQVGLAAEQIVLGDGDIADALQKAYDEANLTG